MSTQDFQNHFSQRSIVITNCVQERLEFNLQDLGKLADVDHQMDIHGNLNFSTRRSSDEQPLQIKQSPFLVASFNSGYAPEL
jgi:hypothetical protein